MVESLCQSHKQVVPSLPMRPLRSLLRERSRVPVSTFVLLATLFLTQQLLTLADFYPVTTLFCLQSNLPLLVLNRLPSHEICVRCFPWCVEVTKWLRPQNVLLFLKPKFQRKFHIRQPRMQSLKVLFNGAVSMNSIFHQR